jgi:16S rRNA (guanine966-N2)-methyltransferase
LGSTGKSGVRAVRRGASARVLRIIGGTWRGRKLRFPDGAGIRPTPDRVRETLFNWLGARLPGTRCLDLFAGSGALGLEALSRGAAHVTFVEQEARAARELALRLIEWEAQGGRVARADALRFLAGTAEAYDLVFLDPPFDSDLLARSAAALAAHAWLSPGALIYVEAGARGELPSLPAQWRLLKAKQAGEVGYYLFAHAGGDA